MLTLLVLLELRVQIGTDAKRLHSLGILDLGRTLSLLRILRLPHTGETLASLVVRPTHNISSGREHALNLAILAVNELVAALALYLGRVFACQIVAGCRLCRS